MSEESGLGLGLNALFEDEESAANAVAQVEENVESTPERERSRLRVGVEQLYPGRFQPRRVFNGDTLDDLADSLKQYGVLQPLLVRRDAEKPDEYEIIAGERRWRAAQRAQMHDVPVIVLDIEDLEAFKIALIENLQREDLDPIDEAQGYQKLLDELGQTQEQLAKAVGKSRPHIANMLRLLNLPDHVQAHLSAGNISMGHARALVNIRGAEELATQIINQGLSVRQTEKLVNQSKNNAVKAQKNVTDTDREEQEYHTAVQEGAVQGKDEDTVALEHDISNALGMRVSIDSEDGRSGRLSVDFKTLDQLDELLHRLAHFPGARLSG